MDRKDFLKTIGITGAAAALPFSSHAAGTGSKTSSGECVIVPSETAGPFPLDLTANTFFLRQDIREDRVGSPCSLRIRIIGSENCEPMANVRVNIWHCDNQGNYSGYGTEEGLTYHRGYQMTDANGEVEFITAFPGWYPGRVCHIHFQVYVDSNYSAVSQYTFDHDMVNEVYAAAPDLYPDGPDPLSPETDGAFVDGYQYQLASLDPAISDGEYESFIEVTVQGTGSPVGLSYLERQNAAQFTLGQNAPNPFESLTYIPLELKYPSKVTLEIWSASLGTKLRTVHEAELAAGQHRLKVDLNELGLPSQSYLYQCVVENTNGRFVEAKRMTLLKS